MYIKSVMLQHKRGSYISASMVNMCSTPGKIEHNTSVSAAKCKSIALFSSIFVSLWLFSYFLLQVLLLHILAHKCAFTLNAYKQLFATAGIPTAKPGCG